MLDFFRGVEMDAVSLKGLERVISCTIGGESTVDSAEARKDVENAAAGVKGKEVDNLMGLAGLSSKRGTEYDEDTKLPVVHFRTYTLSFLRSGLPTPIASLAPHGPHLTFSLRRSQLSSDIMMKAALKKTVKKSTNGPKKSKNEDINAMGDKVARVYVDDQKLDQIQTRKFRGLTKLRGEAKLEKKAQKSLDAEMNFEVEEVSGKVGGGEGRKRARLE